MVLRSTYPTSFKLDKDGMKVWFELLKDLPGQGVIGAVMHMAKTQAAFPSIADIRKIADPKITPDQAWEEVIGKLDRYTPPKWTDPKIKQAVAQLGGIIAICNADETKLGFIRSQFLAAYKGIDEQASIKETFAAIGASRERPLAITEGRGELGDGTD